MDGVWRSQDLNPHCWPTTKREGPPANWVPPPPAGPTSGGFTRKHCSKLLKSVEQPTTSWGPAFQSCTKDPIVSGPCFTLNFIEPPRFVKKKVQKNSLTWQFVPQISPVSSLLANPKPSLVLTWIFPQVTSSHHATQQNMHVGPLEQTGKYYGGDTPTSFSNISTSRTNELRQYASANIISYMNLWKASATNSHALHTLGSDTVSIFPHQPVTMLVCLCLSESASTNINTAMLPSWSR